MFARADVKGLEEHTLIATGGVLTSELLINAYTHGIFPWYSEEPIQWWYTAPRMVLHLTEFKLHRSLRKKLPQFECRIDTNFQAVISACAQAPRLGQNGTWITEAMQAAYCKLHQEGIAHSVEAYRHGELVGGLYGLAIGRMFYGESMFAKVTDASKVALAHLVAHLAARGFEIIDCQQETEHLASMGARPISGQTFLSYLLSLTKAQAAF